MINPDLATERHNGLNVKSLTEYLGQTRFPKPGEYQFHLKLRSDICKKIKPISEENFYNLNRDQKYQMILKKSLEVCEYSRENNLDLATVMSFAGNCIFGADKFTFGLHLSAFEVSIDLWGNDDQRKYWKNLIKQKPIFGTYVQTEIGHGTYIRGLETTATYDKATQEFVIDSPTLTAAKFWPGSSSKTCNYAIVMANLMINGTSHGLHGFIVQLRSLEDHRVLPGIELTDIGMKAGFDSVDNGCLAFNKHRIPHNNMLMRHAIVTPNGQFKKIGNDMLMYASMLCLRAILGIVASLYSAATTTIAIRYSCVRRQTVGSDGVTEPKIIEYKTQQYRLFAALATTYGYFFASNFFYQDLLDLKEKTRDFELIRQEELNKIHAVTAGLKATAFENALKFSQTNRLCCGGHGYSLASGIPQVIHDCDAGSTYEGDNIVLLLQTARFLLKCSQRGLSPHLETNNQNQKRNTSLYASFKDYFEIYYSLYDSSMSEITNRMIQSISVKGASNLEAWNDSSVLLINAARIYIKIYVLNCFFDAVESNQVECNQKALAELLELLFLYELCDTFSSSILRFNLVSSNRMTRFSEKLNDLLDKVRINAVLLVDAFDFLDSNLCSALGAYDGNAYERLLQFAKNSEFNKSDIHDAYENYQKPYAEKLKRLSKL